MQNRIMNIDPKFRDLDQKKNRLRLFDFNSEIRNGECRTRTPKGQQRGSRIVIQCTSVIYSRVNISSGAHPGSKVFTREYLQQPFAQLGMTGYSRVNVPGQSKWFAGLSLHCSISTKYSRVNTEIALRLRPSTTVKHRRETLKEIFSLFFMYISYFWGAISGCFLASFQKFIVFTFYPESLSGWYN